MTVSAIWQAYHWQASLTVLLVSIALVLIGKWALLHIPAFKQTQAYNAEKNKQKYKSKRGYRDRIQSSQVVALVTNIVLFGLIMPFAVSFDSKAAWRMVLDVLLILIVYDFFYYFMHRFAFHGKGWLRRVHGVHHQARVPTSLDSLLLHPMEAFLGIALFSVTIAGLALLLGQSFHVISMIMAVVIYTQLNTLNHVHIELNYFPFKLIHWIAHKHSIHHIDMHRGNFSTITLLFDKLFGTYE